jgi:hypothetical protein
MKMMSGVHLSVRGGGLSRVDLNDMWVRCRCFPKALAVPPNGVLLFAQLSFHSSFSTAHSLQQLFQKSQLNQTGP